MSDYYAHADTATSHTIGRSANVNDVSQAVDTAFDKLPSKASLDGDYVTFASDTGVANAYAVALPQTITAYAAGLHIPVKIANTNTGPSTLNVGAVGAVAWKRHDGTDLQANDLVAGRIYDTRHNGTNFVLTNPAEGIVAQATAQATSATTSAAAALASKNAAAANAVLTAADVVTTGNNVTMAAAKAAESVAAAAAIRRKDNVKAASTGNVTLSGEQTHDGVSLVSGNRFLAKDQTAPAQNGLYDIATGAWTRCTDMDSWNEVPNAVVAVEQGTANADLHFQSISDSGGTLDTTAITWAQHGGGDLKSSENLNDLSNKTTARSNLGVEIGVNVQAYDADTTKNDVTNTFTKPQRGTVTTDNDGSFDLAAGQNFKWTPAAADVLEFTNEASDQSGTILLVNPSGYAITKGSEVACDGSFLTTVSAAGTYLIGYYCDGVTVYVGYTGALSV
ncbi:MAG: hypothetical protein GY835_11295 [bacterium]|nr:hypothetical protein [bacterium]